MAGPHRRAHPAVADLTAARTLGATIPHPVLRRVDEAIPSPVRHGRSHATEILR
jgi:hypothetical protein